MKKKQAFINDWAILDYYDAKNVPYENDYPKHVFSDLTTEKPVILYGRAVNDPRYDPITGHWADGNRFFTSLVCEFKEGIAITENTIYFLGEINEDYKIWCESNNIIWQKFGDIGFKIDPEQFRIKLYLGQIKGVHFYYDFM